ncbi:non-ribosomal peptide synthetase [Streptomyces griseofuscus]|uniref:non-ribosomal peptide synthetase n=1 Tax=Streptomyces griseofuscus TaxID=146922 RepID=UPI0033EFEA66
MNDPLCHDILPSIPALFTSQMERDSSAVAAVDEHEQLTYADLDLYSTRLAQALKERGVGPAGLVAVRMERSVDLLIALLGILRAGAGYVPLDTEAPNARNDLILRQSGAEIVVSKADVDEARSRVPGTADEFRLDPVSSRDVMYVLYTSGTTGTPKGVVLEHGGIANLLVWMRRTYSFTAGNRILQKTPYTFDASVWEFFLPLVSGGTVVFAEPGGHRDPDYLVDAVRRHRITDLQLVPSMLRHLMGREDFASCDSLRRVFCGGEPLTRDDQDRFFAARSASLVNLYGPTETSVQALTWTCSAEDPYASVPIGRPVDNVTVRVLDEGLAEVPVGEVGELHIGGIAVARGYLGDSERTARSFVTDPHSTDPSARLYRTGDLVRQHPDGVFEFLGRRDDQIKVNGQRVEPGEIETVLRGYPGVADAAVLPSPASRAGGLVAYLRMQAVGQEPPALADLRRHLADRLPQYMIPAQIRVTGSFPYSAHGKLDRKALAESPSELLVPSARQAAEAGRQADLGTEAEHKLAEIWQHTLSTDAVGVHDDFFELGGDSMTGLVMIAHARSQGFTITPRELFQLRTISALAATCARG